MAHLQLEERRFSDAGGVTGIFLIGVLLHFYLGNFSKAIVMYLDELRYYGIARGLFNGEGLDIRGINSEFQKIGYSLLLSPFFAVRDGVLRVKLIGLLNSFVIMLSVFPVWLIGKQIGLDRRTRYLLLALTIIWPETMISMTFMSEVLYWPIFLLFVYMWLVNEKQESYKLAIIEGLLCYFGYLTKEIFLALLLAYAAFEIIWPCLNHSRYQKKKIMLLGISLAAFMFCHIVMKLTLFRSLGNSYNQMDIEAILSLYNFVYTIYSFFYYIAAILVTTLVVPFIYPVVYFKTLNEDSRKVFCYVILFLLVASATLAYTISVRENLGMTTARIHLRYIGPAFVVIMAIFFTSMKKDILDSGQRRLTLEILIVMMIYVSLVFKGAPGGGTEQYALTWYSALMDTKRGGVIGVLMPPDGGDLIIHLGAMIANAFVVSAAGLFYYLHKHKSIKWAMTFFIVVLTVVCIADDGAVAISLRKSYDTRNPYHEAMIKEVIAMNGYFKNVPYVNILYVTHDDHLRHDNGARYMDTYMDSVDHLYYVRDTFLTGRNDGENIPVVNAELHESLSGRLYDGVNSIDYIILENYIDLGTKQLANVERVSEISGTHYTVYRNLDPSVIELR